MNKHIIKISLGLSLLLVVIFTCSYFTDKYLHSTSERMDYHIAEIEMNIKSDQWDTVSSKLIIMKNEWDSTVKIWPILIDHFEIDIIENAMTRMSAYIDSKSKEDALAEAWALRKFIQHIPVKSTLNIQNFF